MGEVYKARDSDIRKNFLTQAHLGKEGLAQDHLNKVSITIMHVVIFFSGGGSYLHFIKKQNKNICEAQ